eukprot:TRINITY_DN22044_c0_g1_i1.p1 TRINITY_DN22044_c0_g1~~TRINITY_DN22044_c0_g1_i1.p1  ORF type:complete len:825 (-),score=84.57 TRINITY_DN22044_c0_g1_i1:90-2564(-)
MYRQLSDGQTSFAPSDAISAPLLDHTAVVNVGRRARAPSVSSCSRLHPGPAPAKVAYPPPAGGSVFAAALAQVPAVTVTVLMTVVSAVTYGNIAFPGSQFAATTSTPNGMTIWLLATIAAQATVSLLSGQSAVLGNPAVEVLPVLHAIYSQIAKDLPEDSGADVFVGTCVATTFIATLSLGVLLLICSWLHLARYLRAIPLVVLKGALFGVSLFLLQSAIEISAPSGFSMHSRFQWGAAVVAGFVLFAIDDFLESPLGVAFVLAFVAAIPCIAVAVDYASLEDLRAQDWLYQDPSKAGGGLERWDLQLAHSYMALVPEINWTVVLKRVPAVLGLWLAQALCTLTDLKAIELLTRADMSVDREMRAIGFANIVSACMGAGWPVYMICSANVTCHKLGGRGKLVGGMVIVSSFAALFIIQQAVLWLPRTLPGCVSWWMGLSFMKETLVDMCRKNTAKSDIMIVCVMAIVMLATSFLDGLLLGFLLSVTAFTLQYSGSRAVIRAVSSASTFRSNVERTLKQHVILERMGHRIAVVHVEGYLMFGSSPQLLDTVQSLLEPGGPDWIVLSLRRVTGIDYSAAMDLLSLGRQAAKAERHVLITDLQDPILSTLARAGIVFPSLSQSEAFTAERRMGISHVEHYNTALQISEDAVLDGFGFRTAPLTAPTPKSDLEDAVLDILWQAFGDFLDEDHGTTLKELRAYFTLVEYEPGTVVWRAGDIATRCLGVVEGQLEAHVQASAPENGEEPKLLETVVAGAFVGPTNLLNQQPYIHTVRVPRHGIPCRALEFTWEQFLHLCNHRQALAIVVLRCFFRRSSYEWRDMVRLAHL